MEKKKKVGKKEFTGRGERKAGPGKVRKTKGGLNRITSWGRAVAICREGTGASQTGGGGDLAPDLPSRHQVAEGSRREGLGKGPRQATLKKGPILDA